jgi:DDE family transposase
MSTTRRRNFQLDLFTPDDGHYEYSAVATNLPLGLAAVWAFACGRGAQEKTFAELKGEFALDVVPTKHYAANSAWRQLSILAHNLIRSFQIGDHRRAEAAVSEAHLRLLFRSVRTLRFLLIARAGRLTRVGGRNVLRLTKNPSTEALYGQIAHRLAPNLFADWG